MAPKAKGDLDMTNSDRQTGQTPRIRLRVGMGSGRVAARKHPATAPHHTREIGVLHATFAVFDGNWTVRTAAMRRR